MEELSGCENDEWDCNDVNWVEVAENPNGFEKLGKVEKGVTIGICKDIAGVPLVEVRIWERLTS